MFAAHWQELDEEDRQQLLDGMASSANRLRRLLTDLLTASRLQNSALELEELPVDVGEVVATAAVAARSSHPGVEISVDAEPGLLVQGDRDRLAQAVDNLVGNAVRHGVPPVVVAARGIGEHVEIAVRDAGPGVSEDMQGRLFGRFSTGRSGGGTGLGLYIVRLLARSHGGDATYRPPAGGEADSGAFVIVLPRVQVASPAEG
jgi:signal transduction histidine kinase